MSFGGDKAGYISDRSRQEFIVYKLALLSSVMTLGCYFWLLLPASMTHSAMPGVILFGIATGFSTCMCLIKFLGGSYLTVLDIGNG